LLIIRRHADAATIRFHAAADDSADAAAFMRYMPPLLFRLC